MFCRRAAHTVLSSRSMYVTDGSGARREHHESLSEKEKRKERKKYYLSSRKTLNPNPLYISSTHDAEQRNCD